MSGLLQEELERAIGDGPEHRPLTETLRAGRRRLLRRRASTGAVVLAAVAVLGTGYAVTSPGSTRTAEGHVAVDPTVPPSSPETPPGDPTEPWRGGDVVRYSDGGELEIRPGVVVHEHIENPYRLEAPDTSDALDLTFRGNRTWAILELHGDRQSSSTSQPSNGWASFSAYVADQVDGVTGGDDGWPETMRLTAAGAVVPTAGTTVHNRTDDPRLGESFAPAGATTGAAVVSVAGDDKSYFVVWRVVDGALDVITTPPSDVVGATFDELLSSARARYASEEGLR